jgi:hypothetical protein
VPSLVPPPWSQVRTRNPPAQDGDLVKEHDDVDGQVLLRRHERDGPTEKQTTAM